MSWSMHNTHAVSTDGRGCYRCGVLVREYAATMPCAYDSPAALQVPPDEFAPCPRCGDPLPDHLPDECRPHVAAMRDEIKRLRAEIADAREACPSIRMQDHFDASLLELVNLEVSRGFNRDAEIQRLSALLASPDPVVGHKERLEAEIETSLAMINLASFGVEAGGIASVVRHSDAMHALLFVRKVLREGPDPVVGAVPDPQEVKDDDALTRPR